MCWSKNKNLPAEIQWGGWGGVWLTVKMLSEEMINGLQTFLLKKIKVFSNCISVSPAEICLIRQPLTNKLHALMTDSLLTDAVNSD